MSEGGREAEREAEREAGREAGRVRATAWEVIAAANRPPADGPLQGRVAR
eukprot:COSAG04_NODE_911_length_9469_cov_11.221025_1_plen_49_part_10